MDYSLTNPQNSIWLTEKYHNGTSVNNICGYVYISDSVNFNTLKQAINELVKTNDSMRLKFKEENSSCVQYLNEYKEFDIDIVELSSEKDIEKKALEMANIPFEIKDNFLFKFILFKLPNGSGGFIVTVHHIIGDSWTLGLVAKEVTGIYSEILNSTYEEKQFPSYLNYINYEQEYINSEKYNKDKEYWNEVFKTVPEVASIPSMKENNSKAISCDGRREKFIIPEKQIEDIKEFCTKNKISVYNFFMSAYSLYLGRVSNLDDFVIGTPILNRTNFEQKHTMGMFISTAPLRINLEHEKSFIDFSKTIASNSMSLLRHQKYPYQAILEDLRKKDSNIPNLYNVILSYQITKTIEENSNIKYSTDWVFNGNSADDLQIHLFDLHDATSMTVAYDYKSDKYDSQDIIDMHNRILTIINQVISNNDILLRDIEIITPEEKHRILYEFNNTKVDYPKYKTIVDLFEEQVEKTPDNIAVVFEDQKLTYKELNEKANKLANYLVSNNVKPGDIVGIYLNKSLEVIISMFAILKAGAAFLPLDIDYPEERLKYILNNSKPKLILSSKKIKKEINYNTLLVDLDNLSIYNNKSVNDLKLKISTEDIMYVMYTSGSTGKPKGVMVKHKNIIRLAMYPNFINFSDKEVMVQTGTIVFDACIFEIFGSLLHGFKLYIITKENLLDIEYFSKFLEEKQVTILFLTTGLFNQFGLQKPDMFKDLKYLLTGGDVISKQSTQKIFNSSNRLKIINCYGPTENGSYSTCYQVIGNERNIPIGKPITNSSAYIISSSGALCPVGVPGELWVGGDGVAKGYLNNKDLTSKQFVENPFGEGTIYKTGDLVKWLPDGNIEFIGRIDNQVKVRGFRIELSEIDRHILDKNANIKQALTVIHNVNNSKIICSYIVSNNTIDINAFKNSLEKTLPAYMVPTFIMQLKNLPLNINGKVDRNSLPIPNVNDKKEIILPRNELDSNIVSCLSSILNIDKISISDSFFTLGGDSLSAISFSSKLSNELSCNVSVQDIFEHPVIKDLSDHISTLSEKRSINTIAKAAKKEYYPLSSAQKRMYYSSSLDNNSTLYNIAGGIIVDKVLDVENLQECFSILINRHEALRTHFDIVDNEVVQIIDENIDFKLSLDNSTSNDLNKIYSDFVKPFDLSKAPLFRTKLVKLNDNKMLLLLDMHHIISDGTSLGILLQELCDLYNGSTLSEKQINYKDFTLWEKEQFESEEFKLSKEYWVNRFKDEIPLLNMPTSTPRPSVQSFEGSNYHTKLSKEVFEKINTIAIELNITPYMLMLSAYYILLSKYTSQDDIVVGTPIVGRELPGLSNMLGMFVNTLALRNKVEHSLSFEKFSKTIKENCLNSFKNQSYPFDMLVKELNIKRDTSRTPLFDVMFVYQNNGYPEINFKDSKAEYFVPDNNVSKFDLTLEVLPINNEYDLRFEYCTKLFDEDFIERLSSHYINILNAILENTAVKIADIDMLSVEERNQILYEFNNTKVEYPKDKTIVDLFEEQVERTPDNIAVVFEDKKLTYRELNEKANQLANVLIKNNVIAGDIIGVCLNRGLDLTISIFAILKCGAVYMPMYVGYPKDRLEYMLENSNSKLFITNNKYSSLLSSNINKIIIDNSLNNNKVNFNKLNILPTDLSYVIYTSGSTGKPKGVKISHRNLINFVFAFNKYYKNNINEKDAFLSSTNIAFDVSIWEIFMPLLNGAKLVFNTEEIISDISLYCNNIIKNNITALYIPPNILDDIYQLLSKQKENVHINKLLVGVEPIMKSTLNKYYNLNSDLIIVNGYGPTETTICATALSYSKDNDENGFVSIGKPLYNNKIYIVDNNNSLCPVNVLGELCVSGDGVGKGYLNNEKETKNKFIKNPFDEGLIYKTGDLAFWNSDGTVTFVGRIDNQVKLSGYRIELGEINACINQYNSVKSTFSTVYKNNNKEYLVSYIVTENNVDTTKLISYLNSKLPFYMVPKFIIQIDAFPLTPNGKIAKNSLPLPDFSSNSDYVAPKTSIEKELTNILETLLEINKIGINDNFFEIGIDSLISIKLSIKVLENLNVNISVQDIFNHPTVRDLSDYISTLSEKRSINTIAKAEKKEYYPLSSAQKRIYYSSSLDNNSTLYNIAGGIIVDKVLDVNKLQKCFNTLIERHEALRTHFDIVDNEIVQIIDDNINFNLSLENISTDDLNKIYSDFVKPFDLSKAPLFRTKLVRLENDRMLLLLDMHHIISDGTSLGILLQELCDLYNNNELIEKQLDYKDFTLWEKEQFESEEFKLSKEYWVNQFKDEIPLLNMPTSNPRPSVQSFEGSNYHTKLSKEVFDKVNEVAKELNITPYMLMLSAYYVLLSKYTSQDDIVVGTPIVGRELPELSNMLGMFVNILSLRNTVKHSLTFKEFSKVIKENCLNSFKNQSYPFDMLVKDLNIKRDTSRSPLFDVMFVYQNNGYPEINFKDIKAQYLVPDNNVSKFDLTLEILPINNEYDLRFEYCTKLFDEEFITKLSSHYINILNAILENTEIKIADIDMLSIEERNQILYDFNNIEEPTNNDTFVTLFEEQVKKYPNHTALICDDKSLTYSELNKKANSLAHFLINNDVKQNDIIAIMTDRSLETIVCMLGILKAGAAFVNMDPTYPIERTTYYLNDCKAKCVLKQKHLELPINKFKNVFEIDLDITDIYDKNTENPNININLQSLSYIIYTSGSTGTPKGVVLNHIGLANMCKAMTKVLDYLKEGPKHTLLSVTSTPFDIFVYEIVVPLSHGMKIVLANNAEHRNPKLVDELIRKYNTDVMTVTPSLMKINYDNRETNSALAMVKNMVFGGEPLSEKFVRDLKALSSDITVYNIYGPSEITVLSNVQNLNGEKKITVGPPILNTKIYVLDHDMHPVPIGFSGEIYIGGIQVGCGYLGKKDLTNQKFIDNPFAKGKMFKSGDIGRWTKDGKLQCLGRIDHQVKLRGLRIELGEIEKILEAIPEVDEAVVNKVVVNDKEALCAYYVLNSDIDESFLRNTLREKLPHYMIPTYFMRLDCMPYSINRKIDRKALPTPTTNNINLKRSVKTSVKLNPDAQKLLYIWKNILNNSNIDINDNFFDIGGDSIAAIQIQIEAVKAGINIEYSDIFKYPTIQLLSSNVKKNEYFDISPYTNDKINNLLKNNTDASLSSIHKTKIKNILVVGTTGYLGVHLIYEFLTKHKGNVYCLIRPKNRIEPKQRLEDIFTFYFGKKCFNKYKKRMIIVKGDITLENMGMSQEDINIVKNKVDAIINSGALVKHYGESKLFEDINVLGTQNVVNFCKQNNLRLLHISTISVSGNGEKIENSELLEKKTFSENSLNIGQQINGIYTYTKFKAESIVLNSISEGLDAMILRVGNITNRYSDGVFQRNYKDNAFAKRIKSFIEIGAFPEYFLGYDLELTPVDLCAEAIIKVLYYNSKCNVLHVYNSNELPIKLLFETLHNLGSSLSYVSNETMSNLINDILEDNNRKNIISGIIYDLDNNKNLVYTSNITLNSDFSNKYLSKIGFSWKKINKNYLKRCFKYFNKIGFINF